MENEDNIYYEKVRAALKDFFTEDRELLYLDANERSISHKLAEHLQKQFSGFKEDCEYNRHGEDPKRLGNKGYSEIPADDTEGKTVYPDIIVHKRGNDKDNLMVIEIKKSCSKSEKKHDINKLMAFTGTRFKYRLGLFLLFNTETQCLKEVQCFQNGKEENDTIWAKLLDGLKE